MRGEIKKPPEFAAQRALLAIRSFLARVPLIPCYRGNVRTGLGGFNPSVAPTHKTDWRNQKIFWGDHLIYAF